jgi:acetylglutamate kinase
MEEAQLQANGVNALGICGADGNLINANKREHATVDYGFVGDVKNVNTDVLTMLLNNNYLPVVAPITHNIKAQLLNTNADTIANEIASSLSTLYKVSLIYCFDKVGVLQNLEDENSVIKNINHQNIEQLKQQQIIHSGMLPKIDNALKAISSGINRVVLGHANDIEELVNGSKGTSISN